MLIELKELKEASKKLTSKKLKNPRRINTKINTQTHHSKNIENQRQR